MQERMGDGNCSAVSVVAFASCLSRRRRKRNGGRRAAAAACLSPSWFFARWRKRNKVEKKRAPGNVSQLVDSGDEKKDPSFNQGIGLGLIYVMIASCRNELNKIVDLRLQFETLIQTYKRAAENHQANDNCSTSSSLEIITGCSCSDNNGYTTKCCKKMDELEAEIVAEFGRLQLLDLDSEVNFKHSKQQHDDEVIYVEENEENHNGSSGEVEDDVDNDTTYEEHQNGVSPFELELRLHELLEKRQQERIEELESALESTMRKLHKKDEELWWWKDTAKLISQQVPNIPRFLRRSATTK